MNDIEDLQQDVDELNQTIEIEERYHRFKVTKNELEKRKQFIATSRESLCSILQELQNPRKENKQSFKPDLNDPDVSGQGTSDQRMLQQRIEKDQNLILDVVQDQAHEIGRRAAAISTEVDSQIDFLKGFEEDVENAHERVVYSNRYLDKLLEQTKGNKSWIIIILLTILLIILATVSLSGKKENSNGQ